MNHKERLFTFFSSGTPFVFNPHKEVYDPLMKTRRSLLKIHKDMVREAGRKDVFIVDHQGTVISC